MVFKPVALRRSSHGTRIHAGSRGQGPRISAGLMERGFTRIHADKAVKCRTVRRVSALHQDGFRRTLTLRIQFHGGFSVALFGLGLWITETSTEEDPQIPRGHAASLR